MAKESSDFPDFIGKVRSAMFMVANDDNDPWTQAQDRRAELAIKKAMEEQRGAIFKIVIMTTGAVCAIAGLLLKALG